MPNCWCARLKTVFICFRGDHFFGVAFKHFSASSFVSPLVAFMKCQLASKTCKSPVARCENSLINLCHSFHGTRRVCAAWQNTMLSWKIFRLIVNWKRWDLFASNSSGADRILEKKIDCTACFFAAADDQVRMLWLGMLLLTMKWREGDVNGWENIGATYLVGCLL